MRWLSKYMIWIMAWIGFMNAVRSSPIPPWVKVACSILGVLAWFLWDSYDKPSEEDEER